jgi:glycerate 2-kinase
MTATTLFNMNLLILSLSLKLHDSECAELRNHIAQALKEAILAAKPSSIVRRSMRVEGGKLLVDSISFSLSNFNRVFIIGGGKASAHMALEVERILYKRITGGFVNVPSHLE